MNLVLFTSQALISAAGVLILRASLDGFNIKSDIHSFRTLFPVLVGITLYGASFLLWLFILSKSNVSIAYPITIGLTLVFTLIGANIFLNESLTPRSALGVALITAGVILGGSR